MSKLPIYCICLFYFQVGWGGGGVVWGWCYLINSLQKKTRQPPSCIVKFIHHSSFSYHHFFPKHSFPFFNYHKINLHLGIYIYQSLNSYFFSVAWVMNLSQTVSNHRNIGYFEVIYTCENFTFHLQTEKDVKFVSEMVHKFLENSPYY
jgi:hypothetical protein